MEIRDGEVIRVLFMIIQHIEEYSAFLVPFTIYAFTIWLISFVQQGSKNVEYSATSYDSYLPRLSYHNSCFESPTDKFNSTH